MYCAGILNLFRLFICQPTGKDKEADGKLIENPSGIPDIIDPKDQEQQPAVVIYIVDPFSYGDDGSMEEYPSTATLGLLKCFIELFNQLNSTLQRNIVLQVGRLAHRVYLHF